MREFEHIDWIRRQIPAQDGVLIGPGDDTAMVERPRGYPLITTDMLLDGSCFVLEEAGPYRVGRKSMNVNLSDIAAMAGVPRWAVVSVAFPRDAGSDLAKQLHRGLADAASEFNVALVGGDTNSWTGRLAISVTLIGETTARGPVRRAGARPGDAILVTGPLGGSILGHHLDFQPKVREALELANAVDLHAMIDISDGLARDLHHICEESHCGAVLQAESIPITAAAQSQAILDGTPPLWHALSDGEDFELVLTVAQADAQKLMQDFPYLYRIGTIIESGYFLEKNGSRETLRPVGYEHLF